MPSTDVDQQEVSQILRKWSEIQLAEAVIVLTLGVAFIMAIKWLVPRFAGRMPNRFRFYVLPWEPILRLLVLLFALGYVIPLFIYPTPENLLAISGAVAVALGFAFKDYVSSLIAGVVALYEGPYRNGDWVEIDGVYGEVRSIDLRTVRICTPDDTMVAIPHGKIWTTAIHNANSGQRELMCVVDIYLHPNHDGHDVREKLQDVALASPYLNFKRPIIVVAAEQPWATHYRLKAYPIDGKDQFAFITDLTLRAKASLREGGFQAASVPALAEATL